MTHEVRGTRKVDIMVEEKSNEAKTVARRGDRKEHEYATRALRDLRDALFDPTFDPLWAAFGVRTQDTAKEGRWKGTDPWSADPWNDSFFQWPYRGFDGLPYRGFDELRDDAGSRVYYGDDGSVTVTVDLPGYKKEDLKLTWPDARTLVVTASERSDDEGHYCRKSKTITRRFGHDVDVDSADATFVDGVLTVTLSAVEPAEPPVKTTEIK